MLAFGTSDRVRWDSHRLGIPFIVYDGDKALRCHISRAAKDDHPGTILPGHNLMNLPSKYAQG